MLQDFSFWVGCIVGVLALAIPLAALLILAAARVTGEDEHSPMPEDAKS